MLIEKIKTDELDFIESWYTPTCLIESLFSNFDNLCELDENKFGTVRLYQEPLLSSETFIDENIKGLSKQEKFNLRKGAGDLFCFGGRRFGKSLIVEELDLINSMLNMDGEDAAFASVDLIHIRAILDKVKSVFKTHQICFLWDNRITGAPDYKFQLKNGFTLSSVNFNLDSKSPGRQWFGKHVRRVYLEEASLESEEIEKNRLDAISELGAVFRVSGMTNFTKYSPAGKVFYDGQLKSKVLNLPQLVNPYFSKEQRKQRIEECGGESSVSYKIFVKGEVVEDGCSEFDMQRVKKCYKNNKQIKTFEITKDRYKYFRNLIVLEKPRNCDRIIIAADIGESAGTEIIILAETGDKYSYLYNITLYNLIHDEQLEVFKWIIEKVEANIIGIDCGDALGRTLCDDFERLYSKENVVRYAGASKLNVGFQKDNKGKVVLKNGKPQYRQEYMSEWSVRRLKHLLYEQKCILPVDHKFDSQFNSVISMQSGTRTTYKCISENGDHLFDAWRVFAITEWLKYSFNDTPKMAVNWGAGILSQI